MTRVADPRFSGSPAADYLPVAVLGDSVQVDLFLPADVPVAQLIPALTTLTRSDEASRSGAAAGRATRESWTLRRAASETPISPDVTLRDAGVDTNELLRIESLRTLSAPRLYDDVVDAAARLNRGGLPGWSAMAAGRVAIVGVGLASAIWVCFLLSPSFSQDRTVMVGLSAAVSITLVCVAAWATRLAARPDVGAVLGWCAVTIAAAATWTSLSGLGGYALGGGSAALLTLSWATARAVGAGHGGYLAGMLFFGASALLLVTHAAGVATHVMGAAIAAAAALSVLLVPRVGTRPSTAPREHRSKKREGAGGFDEHLFADPFQTAGRGAGHDADGGAPPTDDLWAMARRRAADRAGVYAGLALVTCLGLVAVVGWAANWPGQLLLAFSCAGLFAMTCRTADTAVERTTLLVSTALLLVVGCVQVRVAGDVPTLAAFGILAVGSMALAAVGRFVPNVASPATRRGLAYTHYLLIAAVLPTATWAAGPIDGWVLP